MPRAFRIVTAFAVFSLALTAILGAAFNAAANMYNADIEGRIQLSEEQRSEVQSVLDQSEAELMQILKSNGIDPEDDSPSAMKLYSASGAMSALGQRTRSALAKILRPEQLQQYDVITAEVEQRIRSSVAAPERPNMSEMR